MREPLTAHLDRLAVITPRLREEFAPEPFVPFGFPFSSVSKTSWHELFGEGPVEPFSLPTPTPLHDPTSTPDSLDFLAQPRAERKRNVRRNRDPDNAYFFMSGAEMTSAD